MIYYIVTLRPALSFNAENESNGFVTIYLLSSQFSGEFEKQKISFIVAAYEATQANSGGKTILSRNADII